MDNPPDAGRLSEKKASLVLDRAAKLDAARGREVDVAELREAALEAGISPEAFERALVEVRAALVAVDSTLPESPGSTESVEDGLTPRSGVASVLHRAGILATGFALGGFTLLLWQAFGLGGAGIAFGLLIALFVAIGLMLRRRREGRVLDFELDLALLWVGLTLILMVGDPSDAEEVLASMSVFGAIAGLVGGTLVALQRPKAPPKELPEEIWQSTEP